MSENYRIVKLPLSLVVSLIVGAQVAGASEQEIEELHVKGIRNSLEKAMDLKRYSPSIQDSIVAEDIGKFPDQNVAESLQRISGVFISRENGEGSKVTVRGFGPEFNAVKVNHRTIATTEEGRAFDFQILPSELISGADIIKASRANIAEGSIGAYVNVNTARPLDSPGLQAAGSFNLKYNDLAEELDPKLSAIVSNSFADDTIGVLFGLSYLQSHNRIDTAGSTLWAHFDAANTEYAPGPISDVDGNPVTSGSIWYPGRATYTTELEKRERTATNLALQWAPNKSWTNTLDLFYTDLNREGFSNGMQVPLQHSGWQDVIVSKHQTALAAKKNASPIDGLFQQVGQRSKTSVVGFNSEYHRDAWSFVGDLAYSKSTASPHSNTFVPWYVNHSVDQTVPGQEKGLVDGVDNIIFDSRDGDVLNISSTIDYSNPASIRAHWNNLSSAELSDELIDAKFDISVEANAGILSSIDFGIAYSDREKIKEQFKLPNGCANEGIEDESERAKTNTCGSAKDMSDDLFKINTNGGFLSDVPDGVTTDPRSPKSFPRDFVLITDIERYKQEIGALRNEPNWDVPVLDPTATVGVTESVAALYGQFNFAGSMGKALWSGNLGLRYAQTKTESVGHGKERLNIRRFVNPSNPNSTDGVVLEVDYTEPGELTKGTDYSNFLPSLNLSFDFDNGFYIKTAAATVITRPALEDIGVDRFYSDVRAEDFRSSGGNPELRPYEANQYDLSFEYYADNNSSYGVNLFVKDISNFISTETYQEYTGYVIDGWGALNETITQKDNRPGGRVSGFELSGLHYFDYLPHFLSGFGVQANYTYTSSKDDDVAAFEQDGVRSPGSGLEGFSENAYNIIGFYEKYGFQARLAYNWRDSFLNARQGERTNGLPQHVDKYGQLDFSSSYDLGEHFIVNFEVINLTNESVLEYADVRERVSLLQYSGRRYQLGITAKF